jgi:hypothetical protein
MLRRAWLGKVNVRSRVSRAFACLAPPRGGALRARVGRVLRRTWFFALLAAVTWLYTFIGAAGMDDWPVYGVYHDLQADGFLKGKLSLPIEPDPYLLAAKNPYDYSNVNHWWLDASYYRGKYYIYWGPVPALLQAAAKWVLRIHRGIGDQYVAVFFHCMTFWCGALLAERVVTRLFSSRARFFVALGALVFAFANPSPHGVATASTYQTAIIAAQAWLCFGVIFAFDAVWHAGSPAARSWRLPLAGTGFALALGSRVTVLPAIALLIPLTALATAWPSDRRALRFVTGSLAAGLPVVAGGLGLLAFNKLRFDHYLEFGSKLQLSAFPIRFSPIYVWANLYAYAFRPGALSCEFPYLNQVWHMGAPAFPRWFPLPADYEVLEPVVGWALTIPLTWLIPFAFVLAPRPAGFVGRRVRAYYFCLLAFSVLASATGAIALFIYGATMRYLNDVTSGLVLLALLGALALRYHRFGLAAPRAVSGLAGALGLATMIMGLLLGYQGYNRHFHAYNPKLDRKLVTALSFCGNHGSHDAAPARGSTY